MALTFPGTARYIISYNNNLGISMNNSEKLCLQWNEFPKIVRSAFEELRDDLDLTDVTLVCNDGKQVEAHKVVLASCSSFFIGLFKKNRHPHPLIYMKGVKGDDLVAMVEFLYSGEANVDQSNLDAFLALADDLRLKGLNGTSEGVGGNRNQEPPPSEIHETVNKLSSFEQIVPFNEMNNQVTHFDQNRPNERAVALNNSSTDEELDNQIGSMMKKSENNAVKSQGKGSSLGKARICKVCGKEGNMTTIQRHIEANHITGLVHGCTICGSTANTRDALRVHMYKHHR